jgi:hypothetical protein
VITIVLDGFLRSPTEAGYIFYGVILLTMIVRLRPWRVLGAVLAGTVAFGLIAHAIASGISHAVVASGPQSTGWIADALRHWVIVPANATRFGNIGFVALICLVIALVQLRGLKRYAVLVPTLYLAACVWEARLVAQPSVTRQILLGAILIVMMNARPHGLLGSRRVEVV